MKSQEADGAAWRKGKDHIATCSKDNP